MISAGQGTRLIKSLVRKKLVIVHKINLGGQGGSTKFLELTKNAYKVLGIGPKTGIGRGAGFEHTYWQYHHSEKIKMIPDVQRVATEEMVMNKCIDILVETKTEKIAVEIAMTPDHEKDNIEKDVEAGCSKIFIGCKDKSVLGIVKKIAESFSDEIRAKITVCLVQKVISEVENYLNQQGSENG